MSAASHALGISGVTSAGYILSMPVDGTRAYAARAAELFDQMAVLLRAEALGGPVISFTGSAVIMPEGSLSCVGLEMLHAC
jgi:hypothetical protein